MNVVDAHVHVWDPARFDYPWLRDVPALNRPFLPGDIDRTGAATRMVFVEADRRIDQAWEEACWAGTRPDWPELSAVVAAVDLTAADLAARLDGLARLPRVTGVRHQLQHTPAEAWRINALADGLAQLAARGLAFDACVRHEQLPALATLLERVPQASVVLDHLGKPPLRAGIDSRAGRAWRDAVGRIARLPQTTAKVSGLAAEAADAEVFARHADPFIAAGVAAFGPDRAMIGSDWPVSAHLGARVTPAAWTTRVRRVTGLAGDAWAALAGRTATRVYRLR